MVRVKADSCPECEALVFWEPSKKKGPHVCAECETGQDLGLSRYEDWKEPSGL